MAINKKNSIISEDIVRDQLQSNLKKGEVLLVKPRIYIGDGSSGKWATPDYAIYNTLTEVLVEMIDAKNGNGDFSAPQKAVNEQGGDFKGSQRAKSANRVTPKAQAISPGKIRKAPTNVQTTVPYPHP